MAVTVIATIEPKNEAFVAVVDAHRVGNGDVNNTELSYLNSVTSNVQDQLDAKQIAFDVGTGLERTTGEVLAVEQATTDVSLYLGDYGGHEWRPGQSFQLTTAGEVTKAMVYFNTASGAPTGVVTLRIETDNAGFPSGTLVDVNATITNADCKTDAWFTFTFPANIPLAALTTYWLVLDCDNQSSGVRFNVKSNTANPYAGGVWADKYDGVWQALAGGTYDMVFRVYAYSNNLHTKDSEIVHDSLSGGAGNKHIDHTAVTLTAGTGLTGGGTIAANRSFALSFLGLESLTDPGADRIMFWDETENAMKWLNASTGLSISGTTLTCTITQYTDALARAALSSTATGLTYTSATGVFSFTAGYEIPTTVALAAKITNPMTTLGDIITAAASGVPDRLGIGSAAQVLTVVGGVPAWANSAAGFANPMAAVGDLILGGAGGAAGRLAIGANTYVLTSNGTTASWAAAAGGAGSGVREIINSLLATYVALDHTAAAYQLLVDAVMDAFEGETGVDAGASTGETYDAGNDWYSSGSTSIDQNQDTQANNAALGDSGGAEYRAAQSFIPSGTIQCDQVSMYFRTKTNTPAGNVTLRIETNSAGFPSGTLAGVDATKAIAAASITDNAWNVFVFPGLVSLAAATTYWIVMVCDNQTTNYRWALGLNAAGGYANGKFVMSTNGGAWADDGAGAYDLGFRVYASGVMTLQSNAFTATTQPTTARLVALERDVDAVTLNTDLKAWVSRDGGTTFTQITLADKGNFDANLQILYGSADISGQPAGTSMKWKITSHNAKIMRIKGVGLLWE